MRRFRRNKWRTEKAERNAHTFWEVPEMRFQKGCIEINAIKDVPLLRQVLHCQLVTHEQLWRFMRLGLYEFQRSSFNWRVRRLVESGLLERHSKLPYTEHYVYSMANPGADVLISHGEWLRVLRHAFHRTIAPVHVCLAGDFSDSFMDMRVTDAGTGVIRSVAAIL
jgi:hypothetical protein